MSVTYGAHDPRVRMREALRLLVQRDPATWDQPSLQVFRNRLLDETGSDARPFAELLLEAIQRGWRDRLPSQPVDESWWDALSGPFVMQWSSERFVQAEMARWAVECWAFAFGVIGPDALRIAPPPRRHALSPDAGRADANGVGGGPGARPSGSRAPMAAPTAVAAPLRGAQRAASAGQRATGAGSAAATARAQSGGLAAPSPRALWRPPTAATTATTTSRGRTWSGTSGTASTRFGALPVLDSWQVRAGFGVLIAAVLVLAVRVAVAPPRSFDEANQGSYRPLPTSRIAAGPGSAAVLAGSAAADPLAPVLVRGENDQVMLPGVPSITGRVLPTTPADSQRILFVEPRQRATGNRRAEPSAPAPTNAASAASPAVASPAVASEGAAAPGGGGATAAATTARPVTGRAPIRAPGLDELRLESGATMRGRVEVIRAGSVIFRDVATGLRHEFRKEAIDEIVTEFGTPVRFKTDDVAAAAPTAPARRGTDIRSRGVAGRYLVRYEAPTTVGSPECRDLLSRPPNTVDVAQVTHLPGADTLTIAFDGGDRFPSNIDGNGYFASTFRIMPDQARTSTALTTRLNGRFEENGDLSLLVSVILYRRTRSGGDITCNASVRGVGSR
jgi:hypothetical protein